MNCRKIGFGGSTCIEFPQDRAQWQDSVKNVMKIRYIRSCKFFDCLRNYQQLKETLHWGVS
jgi:hypothetical protein